MRKKEAARQMQLSEIRNEVTLSVSKEKLTTWFSERKDSPLFYVNGVRLSAGEFWQEFQEMPPEYRMAYNGFEGRKRVAEQLIDRYLVVMENTGKKQEGSESELLKETRTQLIKQLIDNEEIDANTKVTDAEIQAFFSKNKKRFTLPPKSQIRQIKITLESANMDVKQAMDLAQIAYNKLVPGWPKKGASFDEIAKEYDTATLAGIPGASEPRWVGEGTNHDRERRDHDLHMRVNKLGVGEIGKPFVSGDGVYIVQVLDRAKPIPLSLADTKVFIEEEIGALKHEKSMKEFQDKLYREYSVRIYKASLSGLLSELNSGKNMSDSSQLR
jgi:hypothetical protein